MKRYKPAPEPYRFAAKRLGAKPMHVHLVAAHAWDIAGAAAAGLKTIFVTRPRKRLRTGQHADIVVSDLGELARQIAARRRRR